MRLTKDFCRVKVDRCSPPWEDQFRIFICPKWLMGEWEIVAQSRPIELENYNAKGISHIEKIQGLLVVYIELPILWWVRLLARKPSLTRAHRGVQILGSNGARQAWTWVRAYDLRTRMSDRNWVQKPIKFFHLILFFPTKN